MLRHWNFNNNLIIFGLKEYLKICLIDLDL
jgi:hypothetical protein